MILYNIKERTLKTVIPDGIDKNTLNYYLTSETLANASKRADNNGRFLHEQLCVDNIEAEILRMVTDDLLMVGNVRCYDEILIQRLGRKRVRII